MDKSYKISECSPGDFNEIYEIINDAASAYSGVIPADRWHEPYMTARELKMQIEGGVQFWKYTENNRAALGVMGIQLKEDVTLNTTCLCADFRKEKRNRK